MNAPASIELLACRPPSDPSAAFISSGVASSQPPSSPIDRQHVLHLVPPWPRAAAVAAAFTLTTNGGPPQNRQPRPHPQLLRGPEHRRRRAGRLALHRRRDPLLHPARPPPRARDRRERPLGDRQPRRPVVVRARDRRRRRGGDRVDDDLARPEVGRARGSTAAPSGSGSTAAGSPRSAPTTTVTHRTRAATCSASTSPAAATRRSTPATDPPRVGGPSRAGLDELRVLGALGGLVPAAAVSL